MTPLVAARALPDLNETVNVFADLKIPSWEAPGADDKSISVGRGDSAVIVVVS